MRYARPFQSERPAFSHRFDAFSPKLGRPLVLYSYAQLQQWLLLEAFPGVKAFCERPDTLEVSDRKPVLIDFWVQRENTEFFLILREETLPPWQWLKPPPLRIRYVSSVRADKWAMLAQNWQSMLPYLVSYRHLLTHDATVTIAKHCDNPISLGELENLLADQDASWVRACVFDALAKGWLRSPSLTSKPWGRFLLLSQGREYAH